jgi:toxin ParE1/3/4
MAEVVWTKIALHQYEKAVQYIRSERGLPHAQALVDKVDRWMEILESTPQIGTLEPLLRHKRRGYRFVIAWSFKIIYTTNRGKVTIARFFHTSRNPNKVFDR